MSKLGGILFTLILMVVVFGIASFSAEFFFGRPLMDFINDFIFMVSRK